VSLLSGDDDKWPWRRGSFIGRGTAAGSALRDDLSVQYELMEQQAIAATPLDAIAYGTLTGHLSRTLTTLGLKRTPRHVTPTLQGYLETLRQPGGQRIWMTRH
jgi:hypothetical protein